MNKKRTMRELLLIASGLLVIAFGRKENDLAAYVNPFIGASTNIDAAGAHHGLGKTFPGAATPFGMVQVSPNTITGGDNGSGYSYEHETIEGFAMTQMSGVGWYGDLGNFLVMPTTAACLPPLAGGEDDGQRNTLLSSPIFLDPVFGCRSAYDKASETAQAGYYAARLTDYDIQAECTATPRCGLLRFTFPKHERSRILVDLARRVGGTASEEYVEVVNSNTIRGWMRCLPEGGGWGDGAGQARYTVYFYATLSRMLSTYGFLSAAIPDSLDRHRESVCSAEYQQLVRKALVSLGGHSMQGRHIGFFTEFPTKAGETVEMKVGISFVDMEGAEKNYQAEAADLTFDQARRQARERWQQELSRVSVEGGTEDERTIFYTALYHTMIDPRLYADVDGRYVGGDYQVHQSQGSFDKRTIFSGWDVYRSQFPLQTLINPRMVSDMINSLVTLAEESGRGYYERWEFLNAYSGCMIGNPALPVIADAYLKGIRTFDAEKAYDIAVRTSQLQGNGELGYTPGGLSISQTLENCFADWCAGQLGLALGRADAQSLVEKGQAYRNVFDPTVGWFRPRQANGEWEAWPADARTREGYGCIESNPYQQGWFVPHDVAGMGELMGGREKVLADLNAFFDQTPENFLWNQYYNHANEPVHALPFLFNRLGQPWKTQEWTRTICRKAYANRVEGLVGNEDVGQMSAWYVLAASGLHPYCPGDTRIEITSPLFDRIVFHLDKDYFAGKTFTIEAHDNSPENIYIQRAQLNGKPYNRCWLDFSDIAAGGHLELFMGSTPNEEFGREDN